MQILCGIYMITSPKGRIYIGYATNIHNRWYYYLTKTLKGQRKLKNSLNKHGAYNHKFDIIEICSNDKLKEREVYYISFYDTFRTLHGLNLTRGGDGCSGIKWCKASRLRMSKIQKGVPKSDKHRKNISLSHQINKKLVGRKQSPETLAKKEATRKANVVINGPRKVSEKGRKTMNKANKCPWSLEKRIKYMKTRAKTKERQLKEHYVKPKTIMSEQGRKNISESLKGPHSEERKLKAAITRAITKERNIKAGIVKVKRVISKESILKRLATIKANNKPSILKGIKFSEDHCNKISEAGKGPFSKERKAKAAATRKANGTDKPSAETLVKREVTRKANQELIRQERAMMIF